MYKNTAVHEKTIYVICIYNYPLLNQQIILEWDTLLFFWCPFASQVFYVLPPPQKRKKVPAEMPYKVGPYQL